jgi:hypothetical protein
MPAVEEEIARVEETKEKEGILPSVFVYLNSEHILWKVLMCRRKRHDCDCQISGNCELFFG